ncbi:MAG: family 78 glycoside hydrolase catalytic domain [Phycisphaeraceae bacterium]|nr:family 78 glycoside hydrolase catalytic domain [Phycisphaeraceae bacterium]
MLLSLQLGAMCTLETSPGASTVVKLRADDRENPLAIDRLPVRLGWQLTVSQRGMRQQAYHIQAATTPALLSSGTADIWDSGTVTSSVSQWVAWGGPQLVSDQRVHWRVRVRDQDGTWTAWSQPALFRMGLLDDAAWQEAQWITADVTTAQSPLLRYVFSIDRPVDRAYLSVCGLGYYEAFINGSKVGDHVLDPGWTAFHKRAYYATYDVTSMLSQGGNALGVELANGALRGLTQGGHPKFAMDDAWFSTPRLRARLRIEHTDGSISHVVSNTQWRWHTGPVKANDFFRAVTYDARDEIPGWATAAFNDSTWNTVQVASATSAILQAQHFPPCRVVETIAPVSLTTRSGTTTAGTPATIYRFNFSRNIPGWVQLLGINAPAGTNLRITYWEPHKDWEQWDRYICKGGGNESWEPRFVYHGFQYAEVTVPNSAGLVLTTANIRARRVHTDFPQNGDFRASNPVLGRLLDAFKLSYVGNYHSIPTDCPTREKAGWMADAHLVAESGIYYFGNRTAYDKFLRDCLDNQLTSGADAGGVPSVVPSKQAWAGTNNAWGGPAWSAAYPIIAWSLYERSGDRDMLALHYPRLKSYADFVANRLCVNNVVSEDNGAIVNIPGLGDWGGNSATDSTSRMLIATSYHYVATRIVADAAAVLGHTADADTYASRAATIAARFNARFSDGPGSYPEARPARGKLAALFQGLVPAAHRQTAIDAVAANLTTDWQWMGCLTPRWALQELTRGGFVDAAYEAVARTDRNWARWTETLGETTLWEFWTRANDSRNHAFMGMFATWYMEDILGIRPMASHPGFERFQVHPHLPSALTWAEGHFDSIRGRIGVRWERNAGGLTALHLSVPGNSVALLHLPHGDPSAVHESGILAANAPGVKFIAVQAGRAVYEVGAGDYLFTIGAELPN